MLEFIKTKRTYIMLLAVLFVFVSLSDITYSLFLTSNSIAELDYNTGLLDLELTEDKQIVLEKAFPTPDNEAENLTSYTLKIKNIGSLPYLFDLNLISTNENKENEINSKYIKVKVNNNLPQNLYVVDNKIVTNNIIYPNEEKEFTIRIWLDISVPNSELGKNYTAKIVTSGSAIYKTLDNSGANYPTLKKDMIPIYYNEDTNNWHIADKTNSNSQNRWYDYNEQKWANAIILKDSDKKIYDLTRNNDLTVNNIKVNNGNIVIENNYLNIGLSSYDYPYITNIFRLKFNNITKDKIYIISNDNLSYYYDTNNKTFVLKNDSGIVNSNTYSLEQDKWYLIGYSYDSEKVTFYINGIKLGTFNLKGKINKNNSDFKVATDNSYKTISQITFGDIIFYNRILTDNEIASNYKDSISIIKDGLICGYSEFTPMTLTEYYHTLSNGTAIKNDDVSTYLVWIPRFKYRVWNILGNNDTSSYEAYKKGIDIVFENTNNITGEIACQNSQCTVSDNPVTYSDNNKYYTHPAFKNGNTETNGFWVSKYELSTTAKDCNQNSQSGCTSDKLKLESKIGNASWRNNYLSNYYKAITNNKNNYQIIKNTEWGAIAYLSHSNYGLCKNGVCKEIETNKTYISGNNLKDTTTSNIYGVYDMSGGATEYTMSSYTTQEKINNTFKNIKTSDYELYQNDNFILGDATKEVLSGTTLWYGNTYNYNNNTDKWIIRGGDINTTSGIFNFSTTTDSISDNLSTRIVIK